MRRNVKNSLLAVALSTVIAVALPVQSLAGSGVAGTAREAAVSSGEESFSNRESTPYSEGTATDPESVPSDTGGVSNADPEPARDTAGDVSAPAPEERDISAISNPLKDRDSQGNEITIWDCVYYGHCYGEDADAAGNGRLKEAADDVSTSETNGRTPVKWRILKLEPDGEALLLADKPFDADGFICDASSGDEKELVSVGDSKDELFYLSEDEAANADYGLVDSNDNTGSTVNDSAPIGPALQMNLLFSDEWEYAGTVSSLGTVKAAVNNIKDPWEEDGKPVWDCIWFGRFWQEDNNDDGYCFSDDLTITAGSTDYQDQDGKHISNFKGKTGYYPADDKEPIKWRVLDIDDDGNALLLSDRLIDAFIYNTSNSTSWEKCTLRSYLNSTGDYIDTGFLSKAFTADEIGAITKGEDRLFLLSVDDVQNSQYGFINDEEVNCLKAKVTDYSAHKPGYSVGGTDGYGSWWLKTAGESEATGVFSNGTIIQVWDVNNNGYAVRPALRMNLANATDLWRYAGTVDSEGNEVQEGRPVSSLRVTPKQRTLKVGQSMKLGCRVIPGDAADRAFTWSTTDESVATIKDGVVTVRGEGQAQVKAVANDGGVEGICVIDVTATDHPADPVTAKGVSTWDCIWFGSYWQEDTNGDGHCFAKDTVVKKQGGNYYDQDENELYNFSGNAGTYYHDEKQPVKWRVLDIDENGNALLLADRLIDMVPYNETATKVTWKTCTMRSYLNGYGKDQNQSKKDFSKDNFASKVFTKDELNRIKNETVKKDVNSVYGTSGGENTKDRIFCLSIGEALDESYGFLKNEFTNPSSSDKKYYTDDDPTRVAYPTRFTADKPGYSGVTAGKSDWWWLRSLGSDDGRAAGVGDHGEVDADGTRVLDFQYCVRPAFRMNLSESSSYWSYAGTVSSDGTSDTVVEGLKGARTEGEVSTWDCIWFGNYWQEDTNGDGYCFSEDTTVIKDGDKYYAKYSEDDKRQIAYFKGEPGLYHADDRRPVKWRILDIDEAGNALLLADKLIDIAQYNEEQKDVTWETSTLRSYLNCYDGKSEGTDFTGTGFLKRAFSDAEINSMLVSCVKNDDNSLYSIPGGNQTADRLFCLSLSEATNSDNGFVKNEFYPVLNKKQTEKDDTRIAKLTGFTKYKPGFGDSKNGAWWLRSPGNLQSYASCVNNEGSVSAYGYKVDHLSYSVRPAFRMNLISSKSLWRKAGTVCSDEKETKSTVGKITISPGGKVEPGKSLTLDYELFPGSENLIDKDLIWTISDESIVSITSVKEADGKGKGSITVSGLKEGNAEITATTETGGATDSCSITVEKIAVDGVSLPEQEELTLKEGETVQLKPVISPANATFQDVTWKSSDENVATVSENGLVKAVSAGKTVVTVTTDDEGKTATCIVTVTEEGAEPTEDELAKDIDVDPADLKVTMLPGEIRRMPLNKTGKYVYGVRWTVSFADPKVKCVSLKNGVVTAKSLKKGTPRGQASVTAEYRGTRVTYEVTVEGSSPEITEGGKGEKLSAPKTLKLSVGDGDKTVAVKLPKALQGKKVTADKADYGCFTLGEGKGDEKGAKISFAVTAKEAGAAYIVWTVKDDSGKPVSQAVTRVLVKKPITTVTIRNGGGTKDTSPGSIDVGGGLKLIVTTDKGNTDPKELAFKVNGKESKGIKVSKSGYISAAVPGASADITVKSGKVTSQAFALKVTPDGTEGKYLTLNKSSVNAKIPKPTAKKGTAVTLKIATPNGKADKPDPGDLDWTIVEEKTGITPVTDKPGSFTIGSNVSPGCYTIKAEPKSGGNAKGLNAAYCELIIK